MHACRSTLEDPTAPLVEREPDRAWRALYNLGLAYEAAGNASAAVGAYDRFVKRVGQLPGAVPEQVEERRQDAVDRAAALKTTLGILHVASDSRIDGVVVSIDGGPHETLPIDAYLAPGGHEVVAIAGRERFRYDATVTRGESVEVVVKAADLTPPRPIEAPPKPRDPPPSREPEVRFPTAWVVTGAGLTVASFALPIALGVDAWNQGNAAGALGPGHTAYAGAVDDYVSARTRYYASYAVPAVLGATTIAIAIAGAVRVALSSNTEPSPVGFTIVPVSSGAFASLSVRR